MKPAACSAAIACLAFFLASCGKKQTAVVDPGPAPLAVVGGEKILPADLMAEISWRRANDQFVPEPEILLDEMVDRLATVQRARKDGLDRDPDTKRRMESQLIGSLRQTQLDERINKIEISDKDVGEAYQKNLANYTRKALNRFAILFIAADAKSSGQKRTEARGRLETARAKAIENPPPGGRGPSASGFGILANDFSEDQASRYRGGDIGWIEEAAANTRFPAELLETGSKLEVGAVSDVITLDDGFYLIRKTDARPGGVTPLAEVADSLRQKLLREKRSSLERAFVEETRAAAKPTIDRAALSAMQLAPPAKSQRAATPSEFTDVTPIPSR